ncbi:uncharacterized protein LOC129720197 [Wyeomyia smithii]|uniref:uncharacterized protein LOC129720197 n=1 Tax=Wyeomyia smithii TaxID=174621 RepID=UPI002468068D|nr:uncharacterized protein LOC129720197 [Wyeomyia smithii]
MALLNMKQINDLRNIRGRTLDLIFINAEIASECVVSEAVEPLLQTDAFHPALVCNLNCPHTINYNDITNDMKFDFRKADFVSLASCLNFSANCASVTPSEETTSVKWSTSRTETPTSSSIEKIYQLSQFFREAYVQRKENDMKRNPKSFWSFMNEKRKTNGLPSTVFLGTKVAESHEEICNFFAAHFSGVFSAEPANEQFINLALGSVPRDVIDITTFLFTEDEVRTAIRKLKSSVAAVPDGIPSIVLKLCAESIATPLTIIFNVSLSQAKFPEIRSYISPAQHGFFKGRSIDTNLAESSSLCIEAMEDGNQIDTIYTDLKAAFDRVDHQLLLTKIERLGASPHFVKWLGSYLINRKLNIKLGSTFSYSFTNSSGVPQGSNLGPSLYSIFFNDVLLYLPPGCKLAYDDDLKIFVIVESVEDCIELQRLIKMFEKWCMWNQLMISVQKCCVISFTRKKSAIEWAYEINGRPVVRVSVVRDLGVLLDSQLSFRDHHSNIIAKANRNLGFIIRAAKNFRDPYCLRLLFYALVRSVLETASIIWSPYINCWATRIEAIQSRFLKFALRLLPWSNPTNLPPYEDRCRLLNMETLQCQRNSATALFAAKLLLGNIDSPNLLEQINLNVPCTDTQKPRARLPTKNSGPQRPTQYTCPPHLRTLENQC